MLILLSDARDLEPSHIDARLTVPERGAGAWEIWGQDAPSIPEVFLDQVDLGTAEATARTLTPLRLAEGGDGERGLSINVRLIDLLALPAAGLDPRSPGAPRARRLRAPIGRAADGEILGSTSSSPPRAAWAARRARGRDRIGQERAAALAGGRARRHPRPRAARLRARRLQGRRGVRRPRRGCRTSRG